MKAAVHGLAVALVRSLVWLYPPRYRRRVGSEMVEDFRERLHDGMEQGWSAMASLVARTVLDVLITALWEWMRPADGAAFGGRRRERSSVVSSGRFDALRLDTRFAVRTLLRRPGFTLVAVLTLALGVGATTAIFTAVNAVLLRRLPLGDPDRLVVLWESSAEKGWTREFASPANILDWGEQVAAFRDITGYGVAVATVTDESSPEVVPASFVMGNFFEVLGVSAAHGRTFHADEMWSDAAPVVMLSEALWTRRFGRDPRIVGSVIRIDEIAREVVGIMPREFVFPDGGVDVYLPLGWERSSRERSWFRLERVLRPIARLDDEATIEVADAQLQVVVERLRREHPFANGAMGAGMMSLQAFVTAESRMPLLILFGATGLVLLLTCANVANLLLTRASGRRPELALRAALGAGRARIARQLIAESAVLALAGGVGGLAFAVLGVRALHVLAPSEAFRLNGLAMDWRVLVFALAITLATGLMFGMAPALRTAASNTASALHEGFRTTAGSNRRRASRLLVVAEIALALLLVTSAGLLLRSFVALLQVDPGFRIDDRVAASIVLPRRYSSDGRVMAFIDDLVARVERMRGVEAVTYGSRLPFDGTLVPAGELIVEGRQHERYGEGVGSRLVAANWFEVMGVPLVRGRAFAESDGNGSERLTVINEKMAEHFFAGEDPIGRRISSRETASEVSDWNRIIGVVGNEHQNDLRTPAQMEMFTLYRQLPGRRISLIIHTRANVSTMASALRTELAILDPQLALSGVQSLEEIHGRLLGHDRLLFALLGAFATLALVLATVGVYGLMAEYVARRTREIGVRVALGAASHEVAQMVLLQGLKLTGLGVLIGLAAALVGTRLLSAVLFGVAPTDAVTFAGVTMVLGGAAVLACAIPALRASRLEPTVALRSD